MPMVIRRWGCSNTKYAQYQRSRNYYYGWQEIFFKIIKWRLFCSGWPVLASCPVLSIQADLSGPHVKADLFRLSSPDCPVAAVLSWLSCHSCPVQAVLSWQSCPFLGSLAFLAYMVRRRIQVTKDQTYQHQSVVISMNKLSDYQHLGYVKKIMCNKCTEREEQRVGLNAMSSTWEGALSSVAQGSDLGHTVYIVFMNDIDVDLLK
jgi:hypothetical protein